MPKVRKLNSAGEVIYDLDGSVGYGTCKNLVGDVALVQYLLAGYYAKRKSKPLGKLVVDGQFGPMTHYWSLFFQLERRAKDPDDNYIEMGNFLPIGNDQFIGSGFTTDKMIIQLNMQFVSENPHLSKGADKDPAFPVMLRGTVKAA